MVQKPPPSGTPTLDPDAALRRLRLVGLFAPASFIALLLALRPAILAGLGHPTGFGVLGTVLMGSAVGFGVVMYRLVDRTHALVLKVERRNAALLERERIARELHDSLAQVLGVAHLRLRALASRPELAAHPRPRREVDDLADLCHGAYGDVREAIHGLRDATRTDEGLVVRLAAYTARFSAASGVPTTLHADPGDAVTLDPSAEAQVIRVVQEALTNVRKHAGATAASVRVRVGDTHVDFTVEDDGTGFDPDSLDSGGDGFGLDAMRERAESVDGLLLVDSAPGRGTRVVARLPSGRGVRPPAFQELSA